MSKKKLAWQRPSVAVILLAMLFLTSSCAFRQWMYNQAKAESLESSQVFADGGSARPLVPGTVPNNRTTRLVPDEVSIGEMMASEHFTTGRIDGVLVDEFPFPITQEVLDRGHNRYDIYCAPCHGRTGYGDGMVARRGGTPPANYHVDRLRPLSMALANNPDYQPANDNPDSNTAGHIFDVITHGWRNMWSYGAKISPEDRWAIVAYVRALQLSQNPPE